MISRISALDFRRAAFGHFKGLQNPLRYSPRGKVDAIKLVTIHGYPWEIVKRMEPGSFLWCPVP